jgi:hypothetical protein
MWMVRAAGPVAGMAVPQMAIVAVAAIGMFVAVMLLVLGMSRRGTRSAPGHRIRARTRHDRPSSRPSAAPVGLRPSALRPPAAPLNPRRPAPRPPATPVSPRPSARAGEDWADQAGSYGYHSSSRWGNVPDDPRGWP